MVFFVPVQSLSVSMKCFFIGILYFDKPTQHTCLPHTCNFPSFFIVPIPHSLPTLCYAFLNFSWKSLCSSEIYLKSLKSSEFLCLVSVLITQVKKKKHLHKHTPMVISPSFVLHTTLPFQEPYLPFRNRISSHFI